mgnify:CR=1 FL=1
MQRRHFVQATVLSTLASNVWAQASAWPDKPVKFVLSQPPGSGPDNVARLLGDRLAKTLGQPIVIENRPGAAGFIAATCIAVSLAATSLPSNSTTTPMRVPCR